MGNTERKHNSDKLTERTVSVGHSEIDAMQHRDERSKNVSRKIALVHQFRSKKLVVKARNESRVKIALCKCLQNNESQRLKDKTFAIKPCAKRSAARTECYYSDQQSHILQESLKKNNANKNSNLPKLAAACAKLQCDSRPKRSVC